MAETLTRAVWWLCGACLLATLLLGDGVWQLGPLRADALGLLLATFVTFVSGIVHSFSRRYMDGDARQQGFFIRLGLLTLTVLVLLLADNIVLFILAWAMMGLLLARLIGHVRGWQQARHAEGFTVNHMLASSAALTAALTLLAEQSGSVSLSVILAGVGDLPTLVIWMAGLLVVLAAVIQSALWPFQGWLLSSMTAPTPVSAFMHAGLVNAGGFLLMRMAPLLNLSPALMSLVFLLGALSAFLGTAQMLVQNDIKRSLACSTVAQMGFMVMQCGLGFYTAAIAHLMLHGLFKASLFLGAGSALQNPGVPRPARSLSDPVTTILGAGVAVAAGVLFATLTGKTLWPADSGSVLVLFVVLAALQASLSLSAWQHVGLFTRLTVLSVGLLLGVVLYAGAYGAVSVWLATLPGALAPQALNPLHALVGLAFVLSWSLLGLGLAQRWPALYVWLLNLAQPHPSTVLSHRSHYHAH